MLSYKSLSLLSRPALRTLISRGFSSTASTESQYQHLLYEQRESVGLVRLNRPKALNALCKPLIEELTQVLTKLDADDNIGAIVLTGSEKAFAAGADITEMKDNTYPNTYIDQFLSSWDIVTRIKKPIIGAVNGYALGGGCEVAMMCDILLAGTNAMFGQPEIKLGTIPGAGGTQRLCKAIGKSRAMELILTGDMLNAETAHRLGLVSHVYEPSQLVDEAVKMGNKIAQFSRPVVAMAKEGVNASYELPLTQGLSFEKKLFWSTFATKDQKEGMSAFVDKKKPKFSHQ